MSENFYLVLDFGSVCRLCLSTQERLLTDIFIDGSNEDEMPPLSQQIAVTTGINIDSKDNLPQMICYKCRHLVELSYSLQTAAQRSHKLLLAASQEAISHESYGDLDAEEKVSLKEENYNFDETLQEVTFDSLTEQDFSKDQNNDNNEAEVENTAKEKDVRPKSNTCEICLKKFASREKLHSHVRSHYGHTILTPYVDLTMPYNCEQCCRKLKSKKRLIEHHLNHLGVYGFKCLEPNCNFSARSKEALRHHGYKHEPPRFVCETCGATFRRNFQLKQHKIRHTDRNTRYPCQLCGVVCSNRITHRTHVLSHHKDRKYKCDRVGCPKSFVVPSQLRTHLRAHDDDRAFACHLCVATYTSRSLLNRHLRMHETRRVNKCDKCCATFDSYAAFCNHRIGVHGAYQPHKCVGCNQGYQTEARLEKHTARCKAALAVRSAGGAQHDKPTDCEPSRGLLLEGLETLESLLLRNLKSEGPERQASRDKNHEHTDDAVLEPGEFLYVEGDGDELDMSQYT